MSFHDELGTRMKENYESIPKTRLMRRTPVALRLDGKAFHTFTRGLNRPFDSVFINAMQDTMKYLCENIQGCVFGYTQSDEITLILIDYQTFETQAWFDYEVQKMCSIAASMASVAFNRYFRHYAYEKELNNSQGYWAIGDKEYHRILRNKINQNPVFDCRCFNIPKEEVANLIYWRQLDAIRNSIQMVGQANFSHKELHSKSCKQIKEMLASKRKVIWDDMGIYVQRGSACRKGEKGWEVDLNMPIIKDNRAYIEDLIYLD